MRYSQAFIPTLKEVPAEAQVISHVFLIRAGYMRKVAAGIYSFLPLGWRVVKKVEQIVREEMDRAGAQEILMPAAIPAELWQESGRWEKYGPELLRVKDRKKTEFAVSPTAEEAIVDLVRRDGALTEASWGPRWLSADGRPPEAPEAWIPLAGRYRSWNPWAPGFDVFVRGGGLSLELFGSTDVGAAQPLTPLEDGSFIAGTPPSPSRVRFDMPIDGRPTRAVFDAAPFYRVTGPGPA